MVQPTKQPQSGNSVGLGANPEVPRVQEAECSTHSNNANGAMTDRGRWRLTNHAAVQAAAACGVDFYGSWQDSWKPTEHDAHGRSEGGMSQLPAARPVRSTGHAVRVEAVCHAPGRTCDDDGVQGEDGDRRSTKSTRKRSQIAEFPHAWIKTDFFTPSCPQFLASFFVK
jgi:hypothetical protein